MFSYAQQYQWDQYGIGFQVARDFVVEENNANIFTATSSDDEIFISIEPWIDGNVSEDNIADAILELATEMKFYDGGEIAGEYIEVDDFNGYFIITAPNDYEDYDYVVVAILLDTESDTNLAICIGYDEGNFDEAAAIIGSFYAYD